MNCYQQYAMVAEGDQADCPSCPAREATTPTFYSAPPLLTSPTLVTSLTLSSSATVTYPTTSAVTVSPSPIPIAYSASDVTSSPSFGYTIASSSVTSNSTSPTTSSTTAPSQTSTFPNVSPDNSTNLSTGNAITSIPAASTSAIEPLITSTAQNSTGVLLQPQRLVMGVIVGLVVCIYF